MWSIELKLFCAFQVPFLVGHKLLILKDLVAAAGAKIPNSVMPGFESY
jgi:hypothetical protein